MGVGMSSNGVRVEPTALCYLSRLRTGHAEKQLKSLCVGRGSLETPLNASRFVHNAALS